MYLELRRMEIGRLLDFPMDRFGAVLCIGSFGPGRAPASSLDESILVTKPDGTFLSSIPDRFFQAKPAATSSVGA